jgi:hypothetical protein
MIWIGKIRITPREVTMKYTPLSFEVNLRPEGFVVDIGNLYSALMQLHDKRDARGLRYTLVTVLVYVILAKLSGENFAGDCGLGQAAQGTTGGGTGWRRPRRPMPPRILGFWVTRSTPTNSSVSSGTILPTCPKRVPA